MGCHEIVAHVRIAVWRRNQLPLFWMQWAEIDVDACDLFALFAASCWWLDALICQRFLFIHSNSITTRTVLCVIALLAHVVGGDLSLRRLAIINPLVPPQAMDDGRESAEDADVWNGFDKSIAYMKEVASLYEEAFGVRGPQQLGASPANKKIVTKVHLDEANNQAQQALELLASNLLNASTSIMSAIEKQEGEAEQLKQKLASVRQTIRDRQALLDQRAVQRFFFSGEAPGTHKRSWR